ncbi:MFS general substrate transporter [Violaceomyces palustris]|uniref:MFS general substrate transporter n=1 Tax=Violaceomyces palustris TaxID=1673888 RepID=A0ACD0P3Z4_9BASI|nr:MFS general substrate transporter [Violaceomyces palustris]
MWTKAEEKRILLKTDLFALIPAMIVFVSLSLDRGNVANALTDNLLGDLKMNQNQLNNATTLFNVGIVIFEIPWNMMAKRIGPQRFLPLTVMIWGVITLGQAFITNHKQLYVTRFLVGTFEAGFIPGFAFYLGRFYTRSEIASRYAIFWSANAIASIISGVASLGILQLRGRAGLAGWSWLFIIEGIFTIVAGSFALLWFPNSATQKSALLGRSWYTEREASIIVTRVLVDQPSKCNEVKKTPVTWDDVIDTLIDYKLMLIVLMALSGMVIASPVSTYVPSIIKQLGYRGYTANGLAVPGYVMALIIGVSVGFLVNRYQRQAYWIMALQLCAVISLLWVALPPNGTNKEVLYVGALFLTAFSNTFVGCAASWVANVVEPRQRPIALALFVMANNAAGLAGAQVLRKDDAPRYHRGFLILVGTTSASVILALSAHIALRKRRIEGRSANKETRM